MIEKIYVTKFLKTNNQHINTMSKNSLFKNKTAKADSTGINIAMQAIFILGIAVGVTQGVIAVGNFTGLTATIIAYAPVIIVASFLWYVAKNTGMQ